MPQGHLPEWSYLKPYSTILRQVKFTPLRQTLCSQGSGMNLPLTETLACLVTARTVSYTS